MLACITGSVNEELRQSHGPRFPHLVIQRALVADKYSYPTGVIADEDVKKLQKLGIKAIFGPGSPSPASSRS